MSSGATPTGAATDVFAEWRTLLQPLMFGTPEPLTDSLGRIASTARSILRSPLALISVADETGALQFYGDTADPDADHALRSLAASDDLSSRVLERGESVRLPTGDDARVPVRHPALASVLAVPITYEGQTAGGLYLARPNEGRAFGSGEEQIAELVAGAAAAVLRRIRLTQDFRWHQHWLTESAQLTRTVLAGQHGEPLRLLVERVAEMARADVVAVVRQRPDGHQLVVSLGPIDPYVNGAVVDVRSAVLVPLAGPELKHGSLALFPRRNGRAFTSAEIETTAMLAEQMSVALELAQSRADRERLALLDERDRIARDLHDHVIQRLFAIGLTTQSLAGRLSGDEADRLLAGVDDLDQTIEQIRSTIYRLRGPVLPAPRSLPAKVGDLVLEMESVLGFDAELEIHGPVEFGVDDELDDDCIAVLREALTNVARHAEATRVRVSVSAESSVLTLEVSDDGRGIGCPDRRSGLANMRARAEQRGGSMTLTSADGRGTRLTWSIPLDGGAMSTTPQAAEASADRG